MKRTAVSSDGIKSVAPRSNKVGTICILANFSIEYGKIRLIKRDEYEIN